MPVPGVLPSCRPGDDLSLGRVIIILFVFFVFYETAACSAQDLPGPGTESLHVWCNPSPCIFPGFPPCWRIGISFSVNGRGLASKVFGPEDDLNAFLNSFTPGDYESGAEFRVGIRVEDEAGKLLAAGSVSHEIRLNGGVRQDFLSLAIPIDVMVRNRETDTSERHKNTVYMSLGVTTGRSVRLDPESQCYPIPCNAVDQWICGGNSVIARAKK